MDVSEHLETALRILPERVRNLRVAQDLTIVDVAQETGIGRNALSAIERGERIPTTETLIRLSVFYGVSMDWLIGGSWTV